MNHYPHHLGDYAKDTLGLSMLEHGAYRLLLDAYYAAEEAPADDEVYAIARAGTPVERKAVEKVLKKFEHRDGRYYHKRVEEELAAYRERSRMAAEKAAKRWKKGMPEPEPNDSPGNATALLASSHKPVVKQSQDQAAAQGATTVAPLAPAALPPPRGEFPRPDDPSAIALHGIAVASGIRCSIMDAQQWVADGVGDALLLQAIGKAKAKKPGQSVPLAFLQCFVTELRNAGGGYDRDAVFAEAMANIAAKDAHVAH